MNQLETITLNSTHHHLLLELDTNKLQPYTASQLHAASHKRVWWLCSYGHSIFEPVRTRVANDGCGKCKRNKYLREIGTVRAARATTLPLSEAYNKLIHVPDLKIKDVLRLDASIEGMTIEDLLLKEKSEARIYNCLLRFGIRTVGELIELTFYDVSRVRNLGAQSQSKLYELLESLK